MQATRAACTPNSLEYWRGWPPAPTPLQALRQKALRRKRSRGKESFDGATLAVEACAADSRRRRGQAWGRTGVGGQDGRLLWSVASAGRAAVTLLSQPSPGAVGCAQYVFQGAALLTQQLVDLILLVFR